MTFSALDLAQLAGLVDAALPESATVQRRTPADDGRGGQSVSWPTALATVCRIAGLSANDRQIADKLGVEASATLVFAAGSDVRASDRVVAGGVTWTVLAVEAPTSYETRRVALVGRLS
ncbi:MAG: head-tail adaptor protein [Dehalococcoidia bacterium]